MDSNSRCVREATMLRYLAKTSFPAVLLTLFWYSPASAGGLYLNEFMTPSMGTAGAGQEAWANDASTNFAYHNPAGMTRVEGHELSLGAGLAGGKTKFDAASDTAFSGDDGSNQAGLAPILGTHGVFSASDDLKFGMSVFSVSGASLDPDDSWTGRFQVQDIELLTLTANPSVAYRVTDWLSVAGGLLVTYATLDYKLVAPPGGSGTVEIDGDDVAFGFNFGALFELSPETRVGITYVSKQEPEFSGDLDVRFGFGPEFSAASDVTFTFPQLVRIGAYHELNDRWAILGTVGWEDWSAFDSFEVSTSTGGSSVATKWEDTYHFSGGVHYRLSEDWLLQAGITYDTSPVSEEDRRAMLPIDRQIRYAIGAQHQWSDRSSIGAALQFVDLGDAEIDSSTLKGDYSDNFLVVGAVNFSYKF